MYKRNIDILYNYEDVDLDKWRPAKKLAFVKKSRADSVLTIKGLSVQASPHHIFSFGRSERKEIGAVWFVAKLGGLKKRGTGHVCGCAVSVFEESFLEGIQREREMLYCRGRCRKL
jgi:hypothetical protein